MKIHRVLLCVTLFCYIMIQCEPKKYLVRTKSKSFLVKTKPESGAKTNNRKLKGRKKKYGKTGKLKGRKIKHGQQKEFGGDYNDNNDFLGKYSRL